MKKRMFQLIVLSLVLFFVSTAFAFTAVVEKVAVNKIGENLYTASIKMTVNDGTSDVFEASSSAKYNSNSGNLDAIQAALMAEIKEQWDKYADEQGVFTAPAFDTMVTDIQTSANAYINQ